LVESFRNAEGKPRQRTVCTLGRLEAGGEVDTLIASLQRARGIAPAACALLAAAMLVTPGRFLNCGAPWALTIWRQLGGTQKCKLMS
jgi:hypothetical protein